MAFAFRHADLLAAFRAAIETVILPLCKMRFLYRKKVRGFAFYLKVFFIFPVAGLYISGEDPEERIKQKRPGDCHDRHVNHCPSEEHGNHQKHKRNNRQKPAELIAAVASCHESHEFIFHK